MRQDQEKILGKLEKDPYNQALLLDAKDIKRRYADLITKENTWIKQRVKAH